jgi:hypothetical protein
MGTPSTIVNASTRTLSTGNQASAKLAYPKLGWLPTIKRRAAKPTEAQAALAKPSSYPKPAATPIPSASDAVVESDITDALPAQTAVISPAAAVPATVDQPVNPLPGLTPDSVSQEPKEPVARPAAADSAKAKTKLPPPYRFVVSVAGAPSFSAVGEIKTARIGGDLGLSVEYRMTNRLRVRASVIRSVKRYGAKSYDYEAPAEWNWYPGNYEINANCRITELPLDLRFDVISRPTYSVFVSTGINTLLVRNERYNYDYQDQSGKTKTKAVCVEKDSQYPLSVVRLSAGVERQINTRWSLQTEPFVQLPLGNVGAGKVRLSSAGLLFSLKYGFLPTLRAIAP